MAECNEKNGWQWTDEERRERQSPLRRVRNQLFKMRQQSFRTGRHLPQFKTQAEDALRNLEHGLGEVVRMDLSRRGRKHLPLSPEEFDRVIAAIPELMQPWERLVTTPEYDRAVRQANRDIRTHNKVVSAHNAAAFRDLDAVMRLADSGDLGGALRYAADRDLL